MEPAFTRPGLDEALNYCRRGDTESGLGIGSTGRSLKHLIDVVEGLKAKDINFRVLKDGISTDTIGGELTFHIFGALAEERAQVNCAAHPRRISRCQSQGQVGWQTEKMDAALSKASSSNGKRP